MATICSTGDVIAWTAITASATTILNKKLIEVVENRIPLMLNNYFTVSGLYAQDAVTFNASARSITLKGGNSFASFGFRAGQAIFIYNSYENDGYFAIDSVSGATCILASGYSVVDELSGASVLINVVKWPIDVQMVAAECVFFDSDVRGKKTAGVKSHSLGPFSESYTVDADQYGYPIELLSKLDKYRVVRLM